MFNEFRLRRKIKREFIAKHKNNIPKYSPYGQRLRWSIWVYWDGTYDIMTGKHKQGEYKVAIEQKSPILKFDNNVYKYNIDNRKLEIDSNARWE
jgi:hypothetical protein